MSNKKMLSAVGMLLILSLLAGCSRIFANNDNTTAQRDKITNETHTDIIKHVVTNHANKFIVSVEMSASAGSFTWALIDPNGAEQWNGAVDAGQTYDKSRQLPLTPGTWIFKIDMQAASGSYSINLFTN